MSSNFVRTFAKKCVLATKNYGFTQVRLDSTYKAAVLKQLGTPLEIEPQKIKKLEKNQVRIQVKYCSVNSYDVESFNYRNVKLPFTPGYELSGEVIEIGSSVDKVSAQVGDRVAALSANKGGFSEQCVVDICDMWRISSKVKFKQAAVTLHAHANAIYSFSHLVKLKKDSKVVISVGPAGLGLAAVDVCANIFKIKPYGVCFTEELGDLVRERGAFKTAKFNSKNLREAFKIPEGAHVVYDAVGGDIHKTLTTCVKNEGFMFYAAPFDSMADICEPPLNTYLSCVNVEGLRTTNPLYYRQLVQDTLDMLDQSLISAHVSAMYDLKKVNEAIKFIEEKKCSGKVVIKIDD